MDEDGAVIDWINDADGSIKAIFLSSRSMKDAFISSQPVVQMDTTFEVEKGRQKLAAFCYMNPTTNKTEIAAVAFMSDESQDNSSFVLKKFKELSKKDDL